MSLLGFVVCVFVLGCIFPGCGVPVYVGVCLSVFPWFFLVCSFFVPRVYVFEFGCMRAYVCACVGVFVCVCVSVFLC